jgi:hypothetical protein
MKYPTLAGVVIAMIMVGATATSAAVLNGSGVTSTLPGLPQEETRAITVSSQTALSYNGSVPGVHISSFEADPVSCTAYRFTVNATGGNPPYTFSWFFGDNSTGGSAAENLTVVSHQYPEPGDYVLIVRVHDTPGVPLGPYYEDWISVTVANPASECGTQLYIVIVVLLIISAAGVYAAYVLRRHREVQHVDLTGDDKPATKSGGR